MKKTILVLPLIAVCFVTGAFAQALPSPSIGIWKVQGADGLKGEIAITGTSCQLSVYTAAMAVRANCATRWNPQAGLLSVDTYSENTQTHSVPVYGRERAVHPTVGFDPQAGRGALSVGFVIDRMSGKSMSGHSVGFGRLEHVKFIRH